MKRSNTRATRRLVLGLLASAGLIVAACGSDSKSDGTAAPSAAPTTVVAGGDTTIASTAPGATSGSTAGSETTAGVGSTPTSGAGSTPTSGESAGSAGCPTIDKSLNDIHGNGAGRFVSDLECAGKKPLKAEGDPIVIGFQNSEGDPAGSFPEYTFAAQAATKYINEELGGLGSDIQNGKPGRPLKLEVCKMAISPDDSQRCANELVAKKPTLVYSTLNFFGNQFPIYAAAKIPVIVGTPLTVGDFTSPNVYAVGGGGGCVGVHTGLIKFATQNLKGKRIGVPWADTPPGVVCYYDLEAKPMDVLSGKVKGTSPLAGSEPDLQYLGVPIKPASPDVTAQATQILDFKPDVIVFSAQGADCWNFAAALSRLGWSASTTPTVFSTSCLDFDAMKAAGASVKGIYFVGSSGTILNPPDTLTDPIAKFEAETYQSKPAEYGMPADQLKKGFAGAGWNGMMSLWERSGEVVRAGDEISSDTLANAYKVTDNAHLFGSTPLACDKAPAPYVAVCNSQTAVSQWDGKELTSIVTPFSGIDLVAGTQIKTGP